MPLIFLLFLLLIIPIAEISVFIVVGGEIGVFWTIGMVFLTAILGSILLRIEGFSILAEIRKKMNLGHHLGEELAKGAMILVAGILLLTPGFITDGVGFMLFIPFVRKLLWTFLTNRFTGYNENGPENNRTNNSDSSVFSSRSKWKSDFSEPNVVDLNQNDFHENPDSSSDSSKDS